MPKFARFMEDNRKIFSKLANACFWAIIVLVVATDFVVIPSVPLMIVLGLLTLVPVTYRLIYEVPKETVPPVVEIRSTVLDPAQADDADFQLLIATVERVKAAQTNGEILGILAEYRLDVRTRCALELRNLNKGRK